MQKFVAKAKLFQSNCVLKSTTELVALDVNKKVYLKSVKLIEIGTKKIGLCLLVIYYVMSSKIYLGKNTKNFIIKLSL